MLSFLLFSFDMYIPAVYLSITFTKQSNDAKNSDFAQYSSVKNGTAIIATWTTIKITYQ